MGATRTPLDPEFVSRYTRVNLVADPIYGYVEITKAPRGDDRGKGV